MAAVVFKKEREGLPPSLTPFVARRLTAAILSLTGEEYKKGDPMAKQAKQTKQTKNIYWDLFKTTFYISAFTFGGGFVIVSLLQKEFVEKRKLLAEKEMLDLVAIAQSSPGVIAVNTSILIGYRLAGVRGALVNILGTVLPPFLIMSVIAAFYTSFRDNAVVSALLRGMQAAVLAVIIDAILNLGKTALRGQKVFASCLMAVAFVALAVWKINVAWIILFCGVLGFFYARYGETLQRKVKQK